MSLQTLPVHIRDDVLRNYRRDLEVFCPRLSTINDSTLAEIIDKTVVDDSTEEEQMAIIAANINWLSSLNLKN